MTYSTAALLAQVNDQTELHLQHALQHWQLLSTTTLTLSPPTGGWSAAQCLEHLNFYGRHYLPAMEAAIDRAMQRRLAPEATFTPGWFGAYFTRLMMPRPSGDLTKLSAPAKSRPAEQPDARAELAQFIDQQEQLLQLAQRAGQTSLGRVRVPTSLSPLLRLKLGDTLLFYTAHIYRHVRQAQRAIQQADHTQAVAHLPCALTIG